MKGSTVKYRTAAAGIFLIMALTGCGSREQTDQGMQAIKDMDYQTALSFFDAASEAGEDERLIARGQGIAYMGLTDYEQAAVCFEQALQLSDGLVENMDYDLNYYLAAAYVKSGRLAEAEAVYNAILGLKPTEEDACFLRGNARLGLGRIEEAQQDFDKVIAMDAENYDRLIQIYEALSSYGQNEAGRLYLEAALQSGESKMAAYDKGRIYYYLGEYQKAYLALEEAKEKGGAEAYLYLGKAYEATGDYNYASSVYNAYLAKDNTNAAVYNQLGLCEMTKGEYANALAAFQAGQGIENNGMTQVLAFNEIVAYEHLGDYDKAAVLMKSYLETYPDDAAAQREYAFLSTR